mmetsp:Transcript_18674/g.43684  ORF Transcript_18674/g.43684 Transcript_18674/m.43684 type:complete len:207 (+) Transcript_18674:314-934(+)
MKIHTDRAVRSSAAAEEIQRRLVEVWTSQPHSSVHMIPSSSWHSATMFTSLHTISLVSSCSSSSTSLSALSDTSSLDRDRACGAMFIPRLAWLSRAKDHSNQESSFNLHRMSMRMPQKGKIRIAPSKVIQMKTSHLCCTSTQSSHSISVFGMKGSENWMVFNAKGHIKAKTRSSASIRPMYVSWCDRISSLTWSKTSRRTDWDSSW